MIVTDLAKLDCAVVILVGGAARRFNGVDKGLLTLGDQPLAERIADQFPPKWPRYVGSHKNGASYQALGFTPIEDQSHEHLGPMRILPELARSIPNEYMTVSACDTPFISFETYRILWSQFNGHAVYAQTSERKHYCCLLLKTALLASIEEQPHSMRHLLTLLGASSVATDLPEMTFFNINRQSDLDQARELFDAL